MNPAPPPPEVPKNPTPMQEAAQRLPFGTESMPIVPNATPTPSPEASGCQGCMWVVVGGLGVVVLGLVVIVASLFFAGKEATGFIGNMANFFNWDLPGVDWEDRAELPVRNTIYLPTVEHIRALSELVSAQYNYSQIVTGQSDMPAFLAQLYGDGLVMVAVGHIEAGIQLDEITAERIAYDVTTQVLTIQLPAPRLRACYLNERDSYVDSRQTGVFAQPLPNLERNTRQYALRQFRDQALENGILERAADETLRVMNGFLQATVPPEIRVELRMDAINLQAPFPDSCQF